MIQNTLKQKAVESGKKAVDEDKHVLIETFKNKNGSTMAKAFEKIFSPSRIPENVWTDKGKEFYNKKFGNVLKSKKVNLYLTEMKTLKLYLENVSQKQ